MDEKEIEELNDRRVSEWLEGESKCGCTSYKDIETNHGWCVRDAERLNSNGVKAGVVRYRGKIAVFRLLYGESVCDIAGKLEDAESKIK